jgi:hypothetical protein
VGEDRRPIPKDKLKLLSNLFRIDEGYFVDENSLDLEKINHKGVWL